MKTTLFGLKTNTDEFKRIRQNHFLLIKIHTLMPLEYPKNHYL